MLQLNAYLSFDGNCAEAMRFYEKTLSGKIMGMMMFADSPMRDQMPPGSENRVMHAHLALADPALAFMASDTMPGQPYEGMKGFTLTISYDTAEQAQQVFAALCEGGKVTMPMQKTFWADAFGMVVDRFGTPWAINGASHAP